ncbi:homogentisate phytyltransferase 1 chloroplastic isoform X1 [Prunus yedoensis var. nudiflora]|uniref:Homogentisate phytyltransferase 1 chloroplastic isoform X1 n=1 Tax=Prunus yedoensis var. nudiflora TaxID=2094558 RepID=A0A314YIJ4_PRUYE|nr:homogentisate phytyltransferase 1 chloroplastic isoform X1 [Prunus yedoensis var. nudiflora]
MDSVLLVSFPNASAGGNGWRRGNLNKSFSGSYAAVRVSRSRAWNILERHGGVGSQQHLLKHHTRNTKEKSAFYRRHGKRLLVNATAGHPLESEPGAYNSKSIWNSIKNAIDAFYRFSRPHTVIGTALSIISVSLLAVENLSDFSPLFFTGVLEAVIAALFMNIYIVGLNQLSDIDIDKVNKPYLPLASGEYSVGTGIMIVTSFLILSFWLGWVVGSWPLFWALFISFVLGTAYSINLPLLRWKRSAVVAAMCILAVRAVIVQLAFFLHMQIHVYKRPAAFSRPLIFATAFMSFFSVVIALFKDIPDIDGDKYSAFGLLQYVWDKSGWYEGLSSNGFQNALKDRGPTLLSINPLVFWICISLLEMAYGVAVLVGASSGFLMSKCITVLGHAILASILWNRAKSVDLNSKAAITTFYMFIWKLFYAEYLLIPLVR